MTDFSKKTAYVEKTGNKGLEVERRNNLDLRIIKRKNSMKNIILCILVFTSYISMANNQNNNIITNEVYIQILKTNYFNNSEISDYDKICMLEKISKGDSQQLLDIIADQATNQNLGFLSYKAYDIIIDKHTKNVINEDTFRSIVRKCINSKFGMLRKEACLELWKNPNREDIMCILNMLNNEFKLPYDKRGDQSRQYTMIDYRDSIIGVCMNRLTRLSSDSTILLASCFTNYLSTATSCDMKYYINHMLYKSGRPYDVNMLISGVTNSTSPHIIANLIYDIGELEITNASDVLKEALTNPHSIKGKNGKTYYPIKNAAKRTLSVLKK